MENNNKTYWHRITAPGLPTIFAKGTLMQAQAYACALDVYKKRVGTMEVHGAVPMPPWEVSRIGEHQLARSGIELGRRY